MVRLWQWFEGIRSRGCEGVEGIRGYEGVRGRGYKGV